MYCFELMKWVVMDRLKSASRKGTTFFIPSQPGKGIQSEIDNQVTIIESDHHYNNTSQSVNIDLTIIQIKNGFHLIFGGSYAVLWYKNNRTVR